MNNKLLCPSMMCADFGALSQEVEKLQEAGADMFHLDVMDGQFVPNFGLGLQDIEYICKNAKIPCDVHLMTATPGDYIELFASYGVEVIYFHPETDFHAARTIQKIRDSNVKPGIAINPGTSMESIKALLGMVDYVLVMTVNPGFAGQKYILDVDEKIEELLEKKENYGFEIVIDGACSPQVIEKMGKKGVYGFVLGTSALFGKVENYMDIMKNLRQL